jgi:hypothetical protein
MSAFVGAVHLAEGQVGALLSAPDEPLDHLCQLGGDGVITEVPRGAHAGLNMPRFSVRTSFLRTLVAISLLPVLTSCSVTDSPAKSLVISSLRDKPRQFILLGAEQYDGALTFALVEHGFTVKPIAIRQGVAEIDANRVVEYREAGFRYALKLSVIHESWRCVFSGAHRVSTTMSVIDIATNETLAVIKQTGPDASCPPLTPAWDLLAQELARVWR